MQSKLRKKVEKISGYTPEAIDDLNPIDPVASRFPSTVPSSEKLTSLIQDSY